MYMIHIVNTYDDNLEFFRSYNFSSKELANKFANSVRMKFGKVTVETNYVK